MIRHDQVSLREVVESIQYGHTASAAHGVPGPRFLRITDIQNGAVNWSEVPTFDIAPTDLEKYLLKTGDLLFARTGATTGKSFLIRHCPEAIFASYLIRVRPGPRVEPRYLAAFFQSPSYWDQIEGAKRGIGQPCVNGQTLGQLRLPLPPPIEQLRIVGEVEKQFSRLDAAVAALKRAQANLKRCRASVLKAAYEGRLVSTDANEWRVEPLGAHLTRIQAGKSFKCEERPPSVDEVGVVKVSAVTWGEYQENESKTCLNPERIDERLLVAPGDFLFSRANTIELVGACVIAKRVTKRVMLSDKILRLRFDEQVDPRWALYFLRSQRGRTEIERLATGNQLSMRNIGQDRIRQIELPVPTRADQERIVAEVERRLSALEATEKAVAAGLQRAARLRQAVLARAFSGEE